MLSSDLAITSGDHRSADLGPILPFFIAIAEFFSNKKQLKFVVKFYFFSKKQIDNQFDPLTAMLAIFTPF